MTTPVSAANAYMKIGNVGAAGRSAPDTGAVAGAAPAANFGDLVGRSVGQLTAMARGADAAGAAAVAGKGDLVDVVAALTQTEAALETLVALRDRVIASYDEIMRMQV